MVVAAGPLHAPWSYPDFADTFSPEKQSEMPTPKPPYPAAFRQQMVELVRAGRGISDLAREFGCNASSIHALLTNIVLA